MTTMRAVLTNPLRFFGSLRWKRNRTLLLSFITGFVVLIVAFGSLRVTAITSSERHAIADDVTVDIQGLQDLFDDSVVHEISVTFDDADYQRMIATFEADGSKEYIEASMTIDGTIISSVGLRLKGNSTLMSLRQSEGAPGQGQAQSPTQTDPNATPDTDTDTDTAPDITAPDFGGAAIGGMGSTLSFDDPSGLPWLISFDEYVEGQRYQGLEEIAVRPMTGSETMLNEALALNLVGEAGEATQQAAYSSFAVNDAQATLRLLVEVPNVAYTAENFDSDGVLYKSLSTGTFAYLGEDLLAYADSFEQITRTNQQDLAPLINLLRWVDSASDEEFAAELADYVNVDSFARYVALQDLLNNFDDMSGPGRNYYLWYDLDSETFSILTWDLNLAFGQGNISGGGGAGGPGGAGGGQFPGGGQVPEGFQIPEGGQMPDRGQLPEGFQVPEGGELPEGGQMPEGGFDGVGGAGGMQSGNLLKERFLASDAFAEVYAQAYAEVYDVLYGSESTTGSAVAELERLQAVLATTDLIDSATLDAEVAAMRSTIDTLAAAGPTVPTSTTNPTVPDGETTPQTPDAAATPDADTDTDTGTGTDTDTEAAPDADATATPEVSDAAPDTDTGTPVVPPDRRMPPGGQLPPDGQITPGGPPMPDAAATQTPTTP